VTSSTSKISQLFSYSYRLTPELVLSSAHSKIIRAYGEKKNDVLKELEENLNDYYYPKENSKMDI
jgi:hypothetical protein